MSAAVEGATGRVPARRSRALPSGSHAPEIWQNGKDDTVPEAHEDGADDDRQHDRSGAVHGGYRGSGG